MPARIPDQDGDDEVPTANENRHCDEGVLPEEAILNHRAAQNASDCFTRCTRSQ